MKKYCAINILTAFILLVACRVFAQPPGTADIAPQRIYITVNKTSNIVFPYAIKSIDRGSKDVLVQKASGVENVLQLKAAMAEMPETNLTVITADGAFFSYLLNYSENPASLNLRVSPSASLQPVAVFEGQLTSDVTAVHAATVNAKQRVLRKIRDENYGVAIDLKGLYIREGVFYFQLALINNSTVPYDVQQLRFYIRDKKRSRRTASQETELQPKYVAGNATSITGNAAQSVTMALSKFTIPDKKYLVIQMMEQNGGRNLELKISNKILLEAHRL